ncbi:MAG: Gfo/Idh/MocA family oxidoreductase [Bacteroidetes bacterium]|nr:Gfo/Idh/MocA family oxidoreductase [Bacteroidota bacterium]
MKLIKTALCSYGMSGLVFHGPLLRVHPGFTITKILERRRDVSAGKHPGAEIVRSFDAILEDPEIELVVVNTPDHLHHDMAGRAIRAGKHVVVEKPFTLKTEHAGELIALAKKKGVLLTVFQNRRWDGDFLTVKEIIRTGKLGRLVDFESHFDRYRTEIQDSWKDRSTGTGTLYNLGSHLVDQTLHLFGMPEHLYCESRMLRDGALTDDSYDLLLHYPAFKCMVRSSYLVREPGPRFILHGTTGSYLKWGIDPQEAEMKTGAIPGTEEWGKEPESQWGKLNAMENGEFSEGVYPTLSGNYLAFYDNLFGAIRENKALAVLPEEARDVIRIIEAAYQSSREKRVVSLSH